MGNKEIFKKLSQAFLNADIQNNDNNITIDFKDKETVLPAMETFTEVLDDIDRENFFEEAGLFEEEEDNFDLQ